MTRLPGPPLSDETINASPEALRLETWPRLATEKSGRGSPGELEGTSSGMPGSNRCGTPASPFPFGLTHDTGLMKDLLLTLAAALWAGLAASALFVLLVFFA